MMKAILKLEEFSMLLAGIYIFSLLGYSWWVFILLLLTPDIGMVGYIINNSVGAFTYNILHHRTTAILCLALGLFLSSNILLLIGIILFCHACMDRALGYGLKYSDSFWHTHLGQIGRTR